MINKMKTHKGLKARVRVTKRGKVLHRRSGKRHLMSSKRGKKVRLAFHKGKVIEAKRLRKERGRS